MSKAKKKPAVSAVGAPTPKAEKKVKEAQTFSLSEIMKGVQKFKGEIFEGDESESDFGFPYRIPFQHVGLQATTGGVIGGKICEISGDSQTGKSYLLYELFGSVQKMKGYGKLWDVERAFEPAYAKVCSIDMKSGTFVVEENNDVNDFFTDARLFVTKIREFEVKHKLPRSPILLGLDSYPGLQTPADLKNIAEGKDPRGYAAMQKNAAFSQHIDKFTSFLDDMDATLVILNQTRKDHKIVLGDNTTTLGENVIKFWCTQRIRGKLSKKLVKKTKSLEYDSGKETVGSTVVWEVIKNRSVKPFQKMIVRFFYATGMEKFPGLDEWLFSSGKIAESTTTLLPDGSPSGSKKPTKGFKLLSTGQFFYSIEQMVTAHPDLLTPKWTGTQEENAAEIEEDGDDSAT